ncbi:hypothetical protein DMB95_00945 [Campylobacter sp. MIT 12-8780]|uniref:hypothetical protein n=1 Tax=Campylobacter sp. MIT 12-8780 TaxID=2202200 RepID=UPI00115E3583|nr:hypothetical protein [Campylobacter sp. MIT 12-8780]TQR43099.1 hypothetical protein DMB95_00945 [Campylobacter sp. MIT 12-8780]
MKKIVLIALIIIIFSACGTTLSRYPMEYIGGACVRGTSSINDNEQKVGMLYHFNLVRKYTIDIPVCFIGIYPALIVYGADIVIYSRISSKHADEDICEFRLTKFERVQCLSDFAIQQKNENTKYYTDNKERLDSYINVNDEKYQMLEIDKKQK